MRGIEAARETHAQEQRSLAYMVAVLVRVPRLPEPSEWITGERDRAAEVRRWVAAWDRVDHALMRNH